MPIKNFETETKLKGKRKPSLDIRDLRYKFKVKKQCDEKTMKIILSTHVNTWIGRGRRGLVGLFVYPRRQGSADRIPVVPLSFIRERERTISKLE